MSVHPFPTQPVAAERMSRSEPRLRADRVELALFAGLLLTTAAQFALCAWSWVA